MLRNYAKSCLKRKKLLEILQVAIKLASNLWKALGRRGRGGRGGRLVNKALFGEASPRGPQLSTSTLFKFAVSKAIRGRPGYIIYYKLDKDKEIRRYISIYILH